jgi:chromosome partitioning protein
MAQVVSIINMKGGVGKTTLAMQLVHAADEADVRVLAVDLDPQANLTQVLMGHKKYLAHLKRRKPFVDHIFDGYAGSDSGGFSRTIEAEQLIVKKVGHWSNSTLDLVPSRLTLARTARTIDGKETDLKKTLAKLKNKYDLIVIDCPPTDSVLTDAAFHASRHVLVPIKPEFMAAIGLPLLGRSLQRFREENPGHQIDVAGLVIIHSSAYTKGPEEKQSIKEIKSFARMIDADNWKEEEWHVCENHMRYSASYAKAAREGSPIGHTSHVRPEVIEGFHQLRDEIFELIGLSEVLT